MTMSVPSRESVQSILGIRTSIQLIRPVQYETKTSKFEAKHLVVSSYRIHLLSTKLPPKVDFSVNFLEISSIESSAPGKLLISTDTKRLNLVSPSHQNAEETDFDELIFKVFELLLSTFPDALLDQLVTKVDVRPASRWKGLSERLESVRRVSCLCGNFSSAYAMTCDRMTLPLQEDVAWDIDTIYHAHDIKDFTLSDFEYLDPRLFCTLIASLRFNSYFTGIHLSSYRLSPESTQEVLELMKINSSIKELSLGAIGIKHDFVLKLTSALSSNKHSALTSLDISGNLIEDKGLQNLCSSVNVIGRLTALNLSGCGVSSRSVNRLMDACFSSRSSSTKQLTSLDLSDNCLKDDTNSLQKNLLSQPNSLTYLKLSGTECSVDQMMNAISQGCSQKLMHLDLSRNLFKKSGRDTSISFGWNQFFGDALALKFVDLSSTKIPPGAVKLLFHGLASNSKIDSLELNLSANALGLNGALMLEAALPDVHNIAFLDISDNAFDQMLGVIVTALIRSSGYQRLAFGKNFVSSKLKNIPKILDNVAQLLQTESSTIEYLSLEDLRLRSEVTVILNALGTNIFLSELDISGNQMGDSGAQLLAKALQVNNRLTTILWDGNGTTASGFSYVAMAITRNFTLKRMPTPILDATVALRCNHDKVLQALKKIDAVLLRNQNPVNYSSISNYRQQQSFLTGTSQQILDRLVSQIQDVTGRLQKCELTSSERDEVDGANKLMKEEQSVCQLFMHMQGLTSCLSAPDGAFYRKLELFLKEIQHIISDQLQATLGQAFKALETLFPSVFEKQSFPADLKTMCTDHCCLPEKILRETIVDRMGSELMRRTLDLQLIIFTHVVTFTVEELLKCLQMKLQTLSEICAQHQQRTSSGDSAVDGRSSRGSSGSSSSCSILRHSGTVANESKNKVGAVRQSMLMQMVRPLTIVRDSDGLDSPPPDDVFEETEPTAETGQNSEEGGCTRNAGSAQASGPSSDRKTNPSPFSDISNLPVSPPLKNLRWNRPKREKTRAAMSPKGTYERSQDWQESDEEEVGRENGDDRESLSSTQSCGSSGSQASVQQNGIASGKNVISLLNKFKPVVIGAKEVVSPPTKDKPTSGNGNALGGNYHGRQTIHPPSGRLVAAAAAAAAALTATPAAAAAAAASGGKHSIFMQSEAEFPKPMSK